MRRLELRVCRAARVLVLSLLLGILSSCGYTFQGSGSILPPDVKKVYIPLVENNSAEATLTTQLTESLRDRFDRYGAVTVVDEINEADAVLNAKILKVKRGTTTSTARTDTTLQQDIVLTLSAELKRVTGPVLWKTNRMSITQSYGTTSGSVNTSSALFASGGLSASNLGGLDTRELARGQEEEVFNQMVEDAAKKIYEEAVAPDF